MGVGRATELFQNQGPLPSMYAGIDPWRQAGMQQAYGQTMGAGVEQSALQNYQRTQRGDYLTGNPYLEQLAGRASRTAQSSLIGGFNKAGRLRSGVTQTALAGAAENAALNLYGQNYQMERDRMMQSLGYAPQMEQLQYAGAGRQMDLGRMREADVSAQQQEAMRQYMGPWQQLGMFNQALTANPLMAYRKTTQETPFDWGGASLAMVGGLLSPSMPGMGGGGSKA
jgi:hypothetical protein